MNDNMRREERWAADEFYYKLDLAFLTIPFASIVLGLAFWYDLSK